MPHLRTWDELSRSKLDGKNNCMMTRGPHQRLDTAECRNSLAIHINHSDWRPTPFVSFTTSAAGVEQLAGMRARRGNRGAQHLTAVDPLVRRKVGLPVLDVLVEMNSVQYSRSIRADPYRKENRYY
ncbi:hypothetical protein N657DRAFT_646540 [Parathielavia appendiculata]|uniref:Uncharacterized protein n=1 Tax=Parathielavia appendiculata TaxID=2587402 RepID=A0AAN6TXV9_9PEZI|nr:hypothetical protein N657DRAFT_646540 [Parathielavia appendiculata]